MKLNSVVSKFLTNKWVLNIISFIALLNVIGYLVMGNFNLVLLFIVIAGLTRYFSKNMIIVLGAPLLLVNLFAIKNNYNMEGFENDDASDKKENDEATDEATDEVKDKTKYKKKDKKTDTVTEKPETFEPGRRKNRGNQIDYASTIEDAYDQLNSILGSDGIKSLTSDTQNLMQQQAQLAKSMEAMGPMIEKIMPMAEQAQKMMEGMQGSGNLMDMVKKMSGQKSQ